MSDTARTGAMDRLVGARLEIARKALGIGRAGLAARLGCTVDRVAEFESGQVRLNAATLIRLSHICEVDLGFFFAETPPMRHAAPVQASTSS